MATKRAMAMVTRVTGHKEGKRNSGKSNGDGNEGDGQAIETRAMVMRVVGERRR